MFDFTIRTYKLLLATLIREKYSFQSFADFLKSPAQRVIILRHDVDAEKYNSVQTAQIENELGIIGTYYFRMIPGSFDENVIKQIHELGHEIGYHYEDISRNVGCGARHAARNKEDQISVNRTQSTGFDQPSVLNVITKPDYKNSGPSDRVLHEEELVDLAIISFRENLAKVRRVVPVETICMHGSPLSKWDNRLLWKYYDYRDFGIRGEPYFDIDFNEVFYLTDTGRRWDGDFVSIRDKMRNSRNEVVSDRNVEIGRRRKREKGIDERLIKIDRKLLIVPNASGSRIQDFRFHSTFDIINAAGSGILPTKIMLTVHPQRWTGQPLPWFKELVWQNVKNVGKWIIVKWRAFENKVEF